MTSTESSTSYLYDNRNRRTSETCTINGEFYTLIYMYNAAQLTSITYPDQSVVTYEYDSLNRLISIPGYAQFTYTADSLIENAVLGNGVATSYTYDTCQRPTTIHTVKNDTDLLVMGYHYDYEGNITHLEYGRRSPDQQWNQSEEEFQYDWLDRMVSAQGDYGLLTYSYDAVGNRLSQNDVYYTSNNMNELVSLSDGTQFSYDESGNMRTRTDGTDTWVYTYDGRNQLLQVEKNQQIMGQYSYDGDGRRIKKTEWVESLQDYQTIIYVYSDFDVVYERNVDTNQWITYVYGSQGRVAKRMGELTDYYHTDHLQSMRLVTNEMGNVVSDADYTPFGECVVTGDENYLYTGKEKDATGLYYYGARYYDPGLGRFITRDTWPGDNQDPQSLNWYAYCRNNPLKYTDVWGNLFGVVAGVSLLSKAAAALAFVTPFLPIIAIVVVVVVVVYVVYEISENNKELEMGRVKSETKNTPLQKYGVKAITMVKSDSCKAERIIVPLGDDIGTHYTFFKEGNQWYYHPPGEPKNWIPCTDDEARYLEELMRNAEIEYAKKRGGCPGGSKLPPLPPPPPVGSKNRQAC